MRGQVVCGVPFNATDVRCRWDWGSFLWEMSGFIRVVVVGFGNLGIRDNIDVMKEYPKDFFCDIDDLVAPDLVRSRRMHLHDKLWWPGVFRLGRISKISKDVPGSNLILGR